MLENHYFRKASAEERYKVDGLPDVWVARHEPVQAPKREVPSVAEPKAAGINVEHRL